MIGSQAYLLALLACTIESDELRETNFLKSKKTKKPALSNCEIT